MTYVESSVVLAHVFAEAARPGPGFWQGDLVTSRLTEFECWVRTHAYGCAGTHGAALAGTLARLAFVALDEHACARSRAAFPVPVRTLDALHLAAADYLRTRGFVVEIATFDGRMADAARAMGFGIAGL